MKSLLLILGTAALLMGMLWIGQGTADWWQEGFNRRH